MSDIDRLRAWMHEKNLKLPQLARDMNVPYITLYSILERRRHLTDNFVTRFIRCYGSDEAETIFEDFLAPASKQTVPA